MRCLFLSFLLGCFLGSFGAYGQGGADAGAPPTRVYLPSQYNAHSQNFALTQDGRGVLYVANFAGVLEYDGLNWRTIPTTNITRVVALRKATNGTICVGGDDEFGYLAPDRTTGALRFRSLSRNVKGGFEEILAVHEARDGIYFVARKAVFRWRGREVKRWDSAGNITAAFQVGPTLYGFEQERGLSTFERGAWQPLSREGRLPALDDLVAMLPLPDGNALLVTRRHGLFQLSATAIRPFTSEANALLQGHQATSATRLRDGTVVIGTERSGLVLLGADGQLRQVIRTGADLSGQRINALFEDREGNLWLALENGLAQLEVPSPLTLYSESARQIGEIRDIRQVGDALYLAAANGLFRVERGPRQAQRGELRPVAGMRMSCTGLAEVGRTLYVATSEGLYHLAGGQPVLIATPDEEIFAVAASKANPAQLYLATRSGLGTLTPRPGQRPAYRLLATLADRISGIEEAGDGSVWLETKNAGLCRLQPGPAGQLRPDTAAHGLPRVKYTHVATTSQGLLAYGEQGIYRFATDRFVVYNPFGRKTVADNWKDELLEDKAGNIWTVEGDKKSITRYQPTPAGAGYRAVTTPFLPISTSPINVIYPDPQGLVWFGGRDGVVSYDAAVRKAYTQPYRALLRHVESMGDPLFNGARPPADTLRYDQATLAPDSNNISFAFAAATYPVVQALTFRYMLRHYDNNWSDWTATNKKEYTNLPPGQYQFRVQARNIYGTPSAEATYAFTVLAPWYARWWALALFVAAGGLLLYALVRWRLAATEREKQALETLIRERTEEVVSQKTELEKQSDELAVKNDQLEKIDLIVQSINAEVDFTNLFQTILAKFSVIRNMNSASFLIYDKPTDSFRFKALRGNRDLAHVQAVQLTLEQVESRYLTHALEVYEGIYLKNTIDYEPLGTPIDDLTPPKSLITIVIETEGHIEGLITLENTTRTGAFDQRDISMVGNLKEHLIAAFIKTRLLESLENTLHDLENAQDELIRQEKLASVGQLTKGIVDRILNPLNYVTNFSQSSDELVEDLVVMLEKQREALPAALLDELLEELDVLKCNSVKIQEHSHSTTRILKDMQKLLKEKSRDFIETDLNSFLDTKVRAVLQELKGEYGTFAFNLVLGLAPQPARVRLLPFEFGQVVQSLVSNACYTLFEKSKTVKDFSPDLHITTTLAAGQVVVRVRDNGKGIPARESAKLFSPFFTTKPTSKGTGLGLFMSKDIVEIHKGKIEITSHEGEFTEIMVTLPVIQ